MAAACLPACLPAGLHTGFFSGIQGWADVVYFPIVSKAAVRKTEHKAAVKKRHKNYPMLLVMDGMARKMWARLLSGGSVTKQSLKNAFLHLWRTSDMVFFPILIADKDTVLKSLADDHFFKHKHVWLRRRESAVHLTIFESGARVVKSKMLKAIELSHEPGTVTLPKLKALLAAAVKSYNETPQLKMGVSPERAFSPLMDPYLRKRLYPEAEAEPERFSDYLERVMKLREDFHTPRAASDTSTKTYHENDVVYIKYKPRGNAEPKLHPRWAHKLWLVTKIDVQDPKKPLYQLEDLYHRTKDRWFYAEELRPAVLEHLRVKGQEGVKYVDGKKYVKFSFEGYNNTAFSRWLPVDKDGHREL